jgi:hypothetical protein
VIASTDKSRVAVEALLANGFGLRTPGFVHSAVGGHHGRATAS